MKVTNETKVTRPLGAAIGYDPNAETDDIPSPSDVAIGAVITIPAGPLTETAFVQAKTATNSNISASIAVTLDATATASNMLVAAISVRSYTSIINTPTGWTKIGEVNSTPNDSGVTAMFYRVSDGTETTITFTTSATYKRLTVMEFSGVTALDDSALADEQAAAMTYAVGSVDTTNDPGVVVGVVQVSRTTVTFDAEELTEIDQGPMLSLGPSQLTAYALKTSAGTYPWNPTSNVNDTWCGILAAFSGDAGAITWVVVDNVTDGDDATFELPGDFAECLRADLGTAYVIGSSRLRLGTETSGSKTYSIEAGNAADYSDAVELDSVTFTGTGSYTGQDVDFSWTTSTAYRYWRIIGPAESRVFYTWELIAVSDASVAAHIADPTDAHDASAISFDSTGLTNASGDDVQEVLEELDAAITSGDFVTTTDGGGEVISTVASSGSTETLDLADGNVHDVTLDADCTFTFTGATAGRARSFTLLLRQDGTGGWTPTWPGSVVWAGGSAPTLDDTADTVSVLTFFTLDGGTVWYGFATGGGGSLVAALDDLTDVTITSATLDDDLRFDGSAWVNDARKWEPVVDDPGTGPEIVFDSGDIVMEWSA